MKVREIMTENVHCCRPQTSVPTAVQIMCENDCGPLPLANQYGDLRGILSADRRDGALSERCGDAGSVCVLPRHRRAHGRICEPRQDARQKKRLSYERVPRM
jgi:hypothetical protein